MLRRNNLLILKISKNFQMCFAFGNPVYSGSSFFLADFLLVSHSLDRYQSVFTVSRESRSDFGWDWHHPILLFNLLIGSLSSVIGWDPHALRFTVLGSYPLSRQTKLFSPWGRLVPGLSEKSKAWLVHRQVTPIRCIRQIRIQAVSRMLRKCRICDAFH